MAMSMSSTFTGIVRSVNEKGLKLDGHESWMNLSKFAPGVVLPERGETVTVTVDAKGFIRAIQPADGSASTSAPHAAPGAASGQQRDRTITRLAVLKAAAEFSASKASATSGDVLKIAACWERWVLRTDDPTEDNVDAF
jgi:hypothetical protein